MDKQQVLELAGRAGVEHHIEHGAEWMECDVPALLAFAELVAKAERERLYQGALARGIQAVKSSGEILAEVGEKFRAERDKACADAAMFGSGFVMVAAGECQHVARSEVYDQDGKQEAPDDGRA